MIPLSLFTFLTLCVSQLFTKKLRYLQNTETFSCTFTSLPFDLKQMSHLLNVVCQSTIESFDDQNLIIEIELSNGGKRNCSSTRNDICFTTKKDDYLELNFTFPSENLLTYFNITSLFYAENTPIRFDKEKMPMLNISNADLTKPEYNPLILRSKIDPEVKVPVTFQRAINNIKLEMVTTGDKTTKKGSMSDVAGEENIYNFVYDHAADIEEIVPIEVKIDNIYYTLTPLEIVKFSFSDKCQISKKSILLTLKSKTENLLLDSQLKSQETLADEESQLILAGTMNEDNLSCTYSIPEEFTSIFEHNNQMYLYPKDNQVPISLGVDGVITINPLKAMIGNLVQGTNSQSIELAFEYDVPTEIPILNIIFKPAATDSPTEINIVINEQNKCEINKNFPNVYKCVFSSDEFLVDNTYSIELVTKCSFLAPSDISITPIDKDTPMIESISFPSFKLSTLPTIEFKFNKQLEEKPLTIEFFDAINKTSNYTFNSFPYKSLDKQTIVLEFNKYEPQSYHLYQVLVTLNDTKNTKVSYETFVVIYQNETELESTSLLLPKTKAIENQDLIIKFKTNILKSQIQSILDNAGHNITNYTVSQNMITILNGLDLIYKDNNDNNVSYKITINDINGGKHYFTITKGHEVLFIPKQPIIIVKSDNNEQKLSLLEKTSGFEFRGKVLIKGIENNDKALTTDIDNTIFNDTLTPKLEQRLSFTFVLYSKYIYPVKDSNSIDVTYDINFTDTDFEKQISSCYYANIPNEIKPINDTSFSLKIYRKIKYGNDKIYDELVETIQGDNEWSSNYSISQEKADQDYYARFYSLGDETPIYEKHIYFVIPNIPSFLTIDKEMIFTIRNEKCIPEGAYRLHQEKMQDGDNVVGPYYIDIPCRKDNDTQLTCLSSLFNAERNDFGDYNITFNYNNLTTIAISHYLYETDLQLEIVDENNKIYFGDNLFKLTTTNNGDIRLVQSINVNLYNFSGEQYISQTIEELDKKSMKELEFTLSVTGQFIYEITNVTLMNGTIIKIDTMTNYSVHWFELAYDYEPLPPFPKIKNENEDTVFYSGNSFIYTFEDLNNILDNITDLILSGSDPINTSCSRNNSDNDHNYIKCSITMQENKYKLEVKAHNSDKEKVNKVINVYNYEFTESTKVANITVLADKNLDLVAVLENEPHGNLFYFKGKSETNQDETVTNRITIDKTILNEGKFKITLIYNNSMFILKETIGISFSCNAQYNSELTSYMPKNKITIPFDCDITNSKFDSIVLQSTNQNDLDLTNNCTHSGTSLVCKAESINESDNTFTLIKYTRNSFVYTQTIKLQIINALMNTQTQIITRKSFSSNQMSLDFEMYDGDNIEDTDSYTVTSLTYIKATYSGDNSPSYITETVTPNHFNFTPEDNCIVYVAFTITQRDSINYFTPYTNTNIYVSYFAPTVNETDLFLYQGSVHLTVYRIPEVSKNLNELAIMFNKTVVDGEVTGTSSTCKSIHNINYYYEYLCPLKKNPDTQAYDLTRLSIEEVEISKEIFVIDFDKCPIIGKTDSSPLKITTYDNKTLLISVKEIGTNNEILTGEISTSQDDASKIDLPFSKVGPGDLQLYYYVKQITPETPGVEEIPGPEDTPIEESSEEETVTPPYIPITNGIFKLRKYYNVNYYDSPIIAQKLMQTIKLDVDVDEFYTDLDIINFKFTSQNKIDSSEKNYTFQCTSVYKGIKAMYCNIIIDVADTYSIEYINECNVPVKTDATLSVTGNEISLSKNTINMKEANSITDPAQKIEFLSGIIYCTDCTQEKVSKVSLIRSNDTEGTLYDLLLSFKNITVNNNTIVIPHYTIQFTEDIGEMKIKVTYKDGTSVISDQSVYLYNNSITIKEAITPLQLKKGQYPQSIQLELEYPIFKEQIKNVYLTTISTPKIYMPVIYSFNETNNILTIDFTNIYLKDPNYTIEIVDVADNIETFSISSVQDKYSIKSIHTKHNQWIQLFTEDSVTIVYDKPFENGDLPTSIDLILDSNQYPTNIPFNFEVQSSTAQSVTIDIPEETFHSMKIYKIKTHFNRDYLDFEAKGENDIIVVNYYPAPVFNFNRQYYIKQNSSDSFTFNIEPSSVEGNQYITDIISNTTKNTNNVEYSEIGVYSFTYKYNDTYTLNINQKLYITEEKDVSFNKTIESCYFYKDTFEVLLNFNETIRTGIEMNRINVVLQYDEHTMIKLIQDSDNKLLFKYAITDDNKEIISQYLSKEAKLYVIELENITNYLYKYDKTIILSDLKNQEILCQDSKIVFSNVTCDLSRYSKKLSIQNVTEPATEEKYTLGQCSYHSDKKSMSCELPVNATIGKYTLLFDEKEKIGTFDLYKSINDKIFNIRAPKLEEGRKMIYSSFTIELSEEEKNNFPLSLIDEITVTLNGGDIKYSDTQFELSYDKSSIEVPITYYEGDVLTLKSIRRKAEDNDTDNEIYLLEFKEGDYSVTSTVFTLPELVYFAPENETIEFNFTLSIYNPHLKILVNDKDCQSSSNGENEPITYNCTLSSSELSYKVSDNFKNKEQTVYIYRYNIGNLTEYQCRTIKMYNPVYSIEVTRSKNDSSTKLELVVDDGTKTVEAVSEELENNLQKLVMNVPSDMINAGSHQIGFNYTTEQEKEGTFMFDGLFNLYTDKTDLKPSILLEKKNNQNFLVTSSDKTIIKSITLTSKEDKTLSATSKYCYLINGQMECEIDLSELTQGEYLLSYKSICDEKVDTSIEITIQNEESIFTKLPEKTIVITEPISLQSPLKLEITLKDDNKEYLFYYKKKDEATYSLIEETNPANEYTIPITSWSQDKINETYKFAYSLREGGNLIELDYETVVILGIKLENLQDCYYYKESFKFSVEFVMKHTDEMINNLAISVFNNEKEYKFSLSGNVFTFIPDNDILLTNYTLLIYSYEQLLKNETFYLTSMSIDKNYIMDDIVLFDLSCQLKNVFISYLEVNTPIQLTGCVFDEEKKTQTCTYDDEAENSGRFSILSNNYTVGRTFISKPINTPDLFTITNPKVLMDTNTYYMTSDMFNVSLISEITIGSTTLKKNDNTIIYNSEMKRVEFTLKQTEVSSGNIPYSVTRETLAHEINNQMTGEFYHEFLKGQCESNKPSCTFSAKPISSKESQTFSIDCDEKAIEDFSLLVIGLELSNGNKINCTSSGNSFCKINADEHSFTFYYYEGFTYFKINTMYNNARENGCLFLTSPIFNISKSELTHPSYNKEILSNEKEISILFNFSMELNSKEIAVYRNQNDKTEVPCTINPNNKIQLSCPVSIGAEESLINLHYFIDDIWYNLTDSIEIIKYSTQFTTCQLSQKSQILKVTQGKSHTIELIYENKEPIPFVKSSELDNITTFTLNNDASFDDVSNSYKVSLLIDEEVFAFPSEEKIVVNPLLTVLGNIIANPSTKQSINLVFKYDFDSEHNITSLIFTSSTTNQKISITELECKITDIDNIVQCKFTSSSFRKGAYSIEIITGCGIIIPLQTEITAISSQTPLISSISKEFFKLSSLPTLEITFDKVLKTEPKKIEFTNPFNATESYSFTKVDYFSLNNQSVLITMPNQTFTCSLFELLVTMDDDSIVSYNNFELIYHKEFELAKNELILPQGVPVLKQIHIPMKNEIAKSQISKICIKDENNQAKPLKFSLSGTDMIVDIPNSDFWENKGLVTVTITDKKGLTHVFSVVFESPIAFTGEISKIIQKENEQTISLTKTSGLEFRGELESTPKKTIVTDEDNSVFNLTFSPLIGEEYSFTFTVDKNYTYVIDSIHFSVQESESDYANETDDCYYTNIDNEIKTEKNEIIKIAKTTKDSNGNIQYVTSSNSIYSITEEGEYYLQYYHESDNIPFYEKSIHFVSPSISESVLINETMELKLEINDEKCVPKGTYQLKKDSTTLDISCKNESISHYTCKRSSFDVDKLNGDYKLTYNSHELSTVKIYSDLSNSKFFYTLNGESAISGINIVKVTSNYDLRTLKKLTLKKTNIISEDISYENITSFKVSNEKPSEMIFELDINKYYTYQITSIDNAPKENEKIWSVPCLEVEKEAVFYKDKIEFTITDRTKKITSLGDIEINGKFNNEACQMVDSEIKCSFDSVDNNEISVKANADDNKYLIIKTFKYSVQNLFINLPIVGDEEPSTITLENTTTDLNLVASLNNTIYFIGNKENVITIDKKILSEGEYSVSIIYNNVIYPLKEAVAVSRYLYITNVSPINLLTNDKEITISFNDDITLHHFTDIQLHDNSNKAINCGTPTVSGNTLTCQIEEASEGKYIQLTYKRDGRGESKDIDISIFTGEKENEEYIFTPEGPTNEIKVKITKKIVKDGQTIEVHPTDIEKISVLNIDTNVHYTFCPESSSCDSVLNSTEPTDGINGETSFSFNFEVTNKYLIEYIQLRESKFIFYNKYLALPNLDNQYEILQKTLFIINKSVSIQVQYYGQIPDSVCLSTVKESCKKPSSKPINETTIEYTYTFSTEDLTKEQTLYFRKEDEEAANSREISVIGYIMKKCPLIGKDSNVSFNFSSNSLIKSIAVDFNEVKFVSNFTTSLTPLSPGDYQVFYQLESGVRQAFPEALFKIRKYYTVIANVNQIDASTNYQTIIFTLDLNEFYTDNDIQNFVFQSRYDSIQCLHLRRGEKEFYCDIIIDKVETYDVKYINECGDEVDTGTVIDAIGSGIYLSRTVTDIKNQTELEGKVLCNNCDNITKISLVRSNDINGHSFDLELTNSTVGGVVIYRYKILFEDVGEFKLKIFSDESKNIIGQQKVYLYDTAIALNESSAELPLKRGKNNVQVTLNFTKPIFKEFIRGVYLVTDDEDVKHTETRLTNLVINEDTMVVDLSSSTLKARKYNIVIIDVMDESVSFSFNVEDTYPIKSVHTERNQWVQLGIKDTVTIEYANNFTDDDYPKSIEFVYMSNDINFSQTVNVTDENKHDNYVSVEIPEKLDFTYLKYYKIKTHFNHDYLDFTGTGKNDIILVNYIAAPEFTLNRHFYVLKDSSDYCRINIEGSGPLGEVTEIIESNSSSSANQGNYSTPSTYNFQYKYEDYALNINQKLYVYSSDENPFIIKALKDSCHYYKDKFTFTVDVPNERDVSRIKAFLYNSEKELMIELTPTVESNKLVYTFIGEDKYVDSNSASIRITELDDNDYYLSETPFSLTNIEYPTNICKDSPIVFSNIGCDLTSFISNIKVGDYSLTCGSLESSTMICNVNDLNETTKYETLKVKSGDVELPSIKVNKRIEDASFTVKMPIVENHNLVYSSIKVTSEPDFDLSLISLVGIGINMEEIVLNNSDSKKEFMLKNENGKQYLEIPITYYKGDLLEIKYLGRKGIGEQDYSYSQDFEKDNQLFEPSFVLSDTIFIAPKDSTGSFDIVVNLYNPNLAIFMKDDNDEKTPCEKLNNYTYKCTLSYEGLLYKIVDTHEKTQESVYIFKYQYKLPEEKCMTHTENTKQFFTLELETSAEVTTDLLPSVTLNTQKITGPTLESGHWKYEITSLKVKDENVYELGLEYFDQNQLKTYLLEDTFTVYNQYTRIKVENGFFIENRDNQSFIVSLLANTDISNIKNITIYNDDHSGSTTSSCYKVQNKIECVLNLAYVKFGKYKMNYTSMCGEEIQVDSTVDIFIEDTLFDFPEPVINLSGDVRDKKITVKLTQPSSKNYNLYYRQDNGQYKLMGKGLTTGTTTSYSATITIPPSEGRTKVNYGYSLLNGGNIIQLNNKTVITNIAASAVIVEEIDDCLYYKENFMLFVSIKKEEPTIKLEDLKASLCLDDGSGTPYELERKDSYFILSPNSSIKPGEYVLKVSSATNTYYSKDLVLTNMIVQENYINNNIYFYNVTCPLKNVSISYLEYYPSNVTNCSNFITETSTLECKYPTAKEGQFEVPKNGKFAVLSNNYTVASTFISNETDKANFSITNPKTISNVNTYLITSENFNVSLISSLTLSDDREITEGTSLKTDESFVYSREDNQIKFTITLPDNADDFKLTKIKRKEIPYDKSNKVLVKNVDHSLYKKSEEIVDCADGLIRADSGECKLPETSVIKEDKCLSYCLNGSECILENDIPVCTCASGFLGLQCNKKEEDFTSKTVPPILNDIYNFEHNQTTIDNNITSTIMSDEGIIKIRQLSTILVQQPTSIIYNFNNQKRKVIYDKNFETMKSIHNLNRQYKKRPKKESFELINFSLLMQLAYVIHYPYNNNRNLQETEIPDASDIRTVDTETQRLKQFVDQAIEFTSDLAIGLGEDEYINDMSTSPWIVYQAWKNSERGNAKYKNDSYARGLSVVDLGNCIPASSVITQLTLKGDFATAYGKTTPSISFIRAYDENGDPISIAAGNNITYGMPISTELNAELYKYYKTKGIDIYDPNDKAFNEPCYINKNFDYDLPQKYRKNNLYQGFKVVGDEPCTYSSLDVAHEIILFTCANPTELPISYTVTQYGLDQAGIKVDHVDNLPTKCASDVEDIEENAAFWIFLVLFVLIIIFDISLAIKSISSLLREKAIVNEVNTDVTFTKVLSTETAKVARANTEENPISTKDIQISTVETAPRDKTFCSILSKNFMSFHPITSICYSSLISPLIFNSWVFLYTTLNLFGFNALYFKESMLEDRVYDKHRDNFGYPMKSEFDKIISSIVTSLALTVIVRAIALVTFANKEELVNAIRSCKERKDRDDIIDKFNKKMLIRRIIAGVFMLALNVFFFYYCVVFCGIYTNAQYGWLYSGIWSLFWNWVVFAPVYLLIISAVESSGAKVCAYYMKQLFVF